MGNLTTRLSLFITAFLCRVHHLACALEPIHHVDARHTPLSPDAEWQPWGHPVCTSVPEKRQRTKQDTGKDTSKGGDITPLNNALKLTIHRLTRKKKKEIV